MMFGRVVSERVELLWPIAVGLCSFFLERKTLIFEGCEVLMTVMLEQWAQRRGALAVSSASAFA